MLAQLDSFAMHTGGAIPPRAPNAEARRDSSPINLPGSLVQYERDAEIIAQSASSPCCMEVVAGCVRTVSLLEDGRRQIVEFLFPGDLLGWDRAAAEHIGAEAVTNVALRRIPHAAIEQRASSDALFATRLRHYATAQARAARVRCILLGRKTASERVASFLLEMQVRLAPEGSAFDLPMSRTDVADYLGLTTETVCRALSELRQISLIQTERTRVTILNHAALGQASSEWVH
ncbi:MAG: helix-turn-helix domain-containing protein [Acetobacteraceae bacterium]|nr:helix-turn-helix domain-containing protein [Acetobacteraceae bacterium]